jgi:23S rRNA pseudouridine2605 synthase
MLSKLGYCSRSEAGVLIRSGRVAVNGAVRRDPEAPTAPADRITVNGQAIHRAQHMYLMMNKPRGLVTTASDEKGRPTVYSLLGLRTLWVSPVGRLDQASEGLLLFTNDTHWAAAITAPDSHIEKLYRVQIATVASEDLLQQLSRGIDDKGENLQVVRASILRSGKKNSWVEVVLDEGRNRHLRRMFDALGIEVLRLIRVAVGPLRLGILPKGSVRPLTQAEKEAVDALIRNSSRAQRSARS